MDNISDCDAKKIAGMVADIILQNGLSFVKPRWATAKNAAAYSGLGIKKLKELAEKGDIIGIKDDSTDKGIWRFDLKSIDKFFLNQANIPNPERFKQLLGGIK